VTFLLDTCVVSELVKVRPDKNVLRWIDSVEEQKLFLSVLTFGELEKGITKLPDSKRKDNLREWLENDLAKRFNGRILSIDFAVAAGWGKLQGEAECKGEKLPVIDSLLAATAEIFRLTLVTRNIADFKHCGVIIYNPWDDQSDHLYPGG
jgi:toxin FitB